MTSTDEMIEGIERTKGKNYARIVMLRSLPITNETISELVALEAENMAHEEVILELIESGTST